MLSWTDDYFIRTVLCKENGIIPKVLGKSFLSIQFHHPVQEECCVPYTTKDASSIDTIEYKRLLLSFR